VQFTGFSGGGPGFNTDAFRFPDDGVIVVILDNTTQYNHWRMGPAINEILAGETPRMPLPLLSDLLVEVVAERGLAEALVQYADITENRRDEYATGSLEAEINTLGYAALALHETRLAIEILKLNVELHPNSWNVYDSLGEAYVAAGDTERGAQYATIAREVRDREATIMRHVRAAEFDDARRIIEVAHQANAELQLLTPSRIGPYFEEVMASGDLDLAIEVCEIWALADPGVAGPYFSMARVHRAQGNIEQLKATYERILEIQPEGPAADAARRALEDLGR
jgi:tetratricopeptide (TPR) repeat protein